MSKIMTKLASVVNNKSFLKLLAVDLAILVLGVWLHDVIMRTNFMSHIVHLVIIFAAIHIVWEYVDIEKKLNMRR